MQIFFLRFFFMAKNVVLRNIIKIFIAILGVYAQYINGIFKFVFLNNKNKG